MARWDGSFLVHATVNLTLQRTLHEESDDVLINFDAYVPALNHGLREILDDGPIYMHMPATPPLCASCREETEK
jgi:hypothetical protein